MSVTKPLLRYHGSKWQIADKVIRHLPSHYTYVEPFGGGAAVLLRKEPSKAELYNDLDSEITNLFRVLRDHREELLEKLFYTPFSRDAYYEAFDKARSPEGISDPIEAARVTLTISFQSHTNAGVTRASRSGWKCWIKPGWSQTPSDYWGGLNERINEVAERLRAVNVENKDAIEVIRQWDDSETLFYCDPPYIEDTRKEGLGAYRHEMSLEQHEALADLLCSAKGKVVISGYDSPHYHRWYKGWEVHAFPSRVEGRQDAMEYLWVSPAAARDNQMSLFAAVA